MKSDSSTSSFNSLRNITLIVLLLSDVAFFASHLDSKLYVIQMSLSFLFIAHILILGNYSATILSLVQFLLRNDAGFSKNSSKRIMQMPNNYLAAFLNFCVLGLLSLLWFTWFVL